MFATNVGRTDRAIRIIVGIVLLAAIPLLPDAGWRWFLLIGIVPLVTGLAGTCPAYSLLGLNTCSVGTGRP